MFKFFSGKKTIIVGAAMIVYAVSGMFLGHMDATQAWATILEGAGFITVRAAIAKMGG